MKKTLALILAMMMLLSLAACGAQQTAPATNEAPAAAEETAVEEAAAPAIKVGVILDADENAGYTYAHMMGVREAVKNLGLDEATNIIWKYNIGDNQECYDECVNLVDEGCNLVICIGYGHQSFSQMAAAEFPEVEFINMTGDTAKASGLENFHNAFTEIYEARYLSGVVAGLKIQELIDNGELTDANYDADGNVKIGYVGAFNYAEVISGYTAFYLGVRSVVENCAMKVIYTNSWFDVSAEKEAATALINEGCVVIGQHADSSGAPSACEEARAAGTQAYSVGYNVDMTTAAPNAALTSPTNEWGVYYTYAIGSVMNGEKFATNWAEGFDQDAVALTALSANCAAGTQEAVDAVLAQLKDGSLKVFDTSKFTVGGETLTSAFATDTDGDWVNDADEAIFDGFFHESYFQSAPCFGIIIDGISE